MGKYDSLRQYLEGLAVSERKVTFRELEKILGFPLPASARLYPAWWANNRGPHSQSSSWLDAGWLSGDVDLASERVTFRRGSVPKQRTAASKVPQIQTRGQDVSHSWDIADTSECSLVMQWQPIGRITLGESGRLEFPRAPQRPGLYRFRVRGGAKEAVYVGESDNVSRRFGNYRNPGPTQKTSLRINGKLREVLAISAEIAVATISDAWFVRSGKRTAVDFSSKTVRCLFENAALVNLGASDIASLNRSERSKA